VLARFGGATWRAVYGASGLGNGDCGFAYSCTLNGCDEEGKAFWTGTCDDGALGMGAASCAHPAGTMITERKMAARKRAAAARGNAVNSLKRCIRIISIDLIH
jgi:hypothetical protein